MPQGAPDDNYNIYIYVKIIDNENGVTVYHIPSPIQVLPNTQAANLALNLVNSVDPNNQISQEINSKNLNLVSKNVLVLASVLNRASAALTNDQKSVIRDYLINKISSLTLSDMSSVNLIASSLSLLTSSPDQMSKLASVNFLKI